MTIDKAIEIQTIDNEHNPSFTDADRHEAHRLGLEGLKRLRNYRTLDFCSAAILLPGETKE